MKTCSLYGFIWALATAFLTFALYFLGFHSDPAKLTAATWIGGLGGFAIATACTALGVKAVRAEVPVAEDFGYSRAMGAGAKVSIVAAILSAIFNYVYMAYINPGFVDIMVQDQVQKLEARGVTGDALDKAEAGIRWMMAPVPQAVTTLILVFIAGVIISLVVAAILKRPAHLAPQV